jgi:hypothetical protein
VKKVKVSPHSTGVTQWINITKTAACADIVDSSYIECKGCSRKFDPDSPQQKFCSKRCRQKFHNNKKALKDNKKALKG